MTKKKATHDQAAGQAPGRLLGVSEVARMLGCSATLVHEAINRGELPAVRLGRGRGVFRICITDVNRYLERRRIIH